MTVRWPARFPCANQCGRYAMRGIPQCATCYAASPEGIAEAARFRPSTPPSQERSNP